MAPFPVALRSDFDRYLSLASTLSGDDRVTQEVRDLIPKSRLLSDGIVAAVRFSEQGATATARRAFEQAVEPLRPELSIMRANGLASGNERRLYRMRRIDGGVVPSRPDLFHVPFDRRELVAPQRYSLLGVPMLYLGSSLMVCWEELGRPPLADTWVAAFDLKPDVDRKVLDFGMPPSFWAKAGEEIGGVERLGRLGPLAAAAVALWPLIAACSYTRTNAHAYYTAEYVVPQMLLSWLVEIDGLAGVRYCSNRLTAPEMWTGALNYVLPARSDRDDGQSAELMAIITALVATCGSAPAAVL